jgi:hypothetical protein
VYFVLASPYVAETSGSLTQYRGWHTYKFYGSTAIKYSFLGNAAANMGACSEQSTNEAPPQTDEVYWIVGGIGIIREVAPVDSGEPHAALAKDIGRRSGSRSRRIGVVPEPR